LCQKAKIPPTKDPDPETIVGQVSSEDQRSKRGCPRETKWDTPWDVAPSAQTQDSTTWEARLPGQSVYLKVYACHAYFPAGTTTRQRDYSCCVTADEQRELHLQEGRAAALEYRDDL